MAEKNFIDTIISYVAPQRAAERMAYREMMASYNGAVATRQDQPWNLEYGNPTIANAGLAYGAQASLRSRCRNLCQNNAIASGMLDRIVTNIVGPSGFGLHPLSSDAGWNDTCKQLFSDWFDVADVTGNAWLEHQRLAVTHWYRDGDFGSILGIDGRIQPIDPAQIATPTSKGSDPLCVDGVQVSELGRPLAYYVNQYNGYSKLTKSAVVNAQDMLFILRKKSISQLRGEPCFATAARTFDQLDQIQQAVLDAWKIQAFFALAITKQNQIAALKGLPKDKAANGEAGQRQLAVKSGTAQYLKPGEDIKALQSSQPSPNFPENFLLNLRTLGVENGLPLELVLLDFSKTTNSSARAALLQAYQTFKTSQNLFISKYLSRIYRWRVSKWIKEGKLKDNPDKFNHRWVAAPFPYYDPIAEMQSLQMGIDIGIESLSGACLSMGRDFESILRVKTEERKDLAKANIPLLHSAAMQEYRSETTPTDLNSPNLNNELLIDNDTQGGKDE